MSAAGSSGPGRGGVTCPAGRLYRAVTSIVAPPDSRTVDGAVASVTTSRGRTWRMRPASSFSPARGFTATMIAPAYVAPSQANRYSGVFCAGRKHELTGPDAQLGERGRRPPHEGVRLRERERPALGVQPDPGRRGRDGLIEEIGDRGGHGARPSSPPEHSSRKLTLAGGDEGVRTRYTPPRGSGRSVIERLLIAVGILVVNGFVLVMVLRLLTMVVIRRVPNRSDEAVAPIPVGASAQPPPVSEPEPELVAAAAAAAAVSEPVVAHARGPETAGAAPTGPCTESITTGCCSECLCSRRSSHPGRGSATRSVGKAPPTQPP